MNALMYMSCSLGSILQGKQTKKQGCKCGQAWALFQYFTAFFFSDKWLVMIMQDWQGTILATSFLMRVLFWRIFKSSQKPHDLISFWRKNKDFQFLREVTVTNALSGFPNILVSSSDQLASNHFGKAVLLKQAHAAWTQKRVSWNERV